MSMKGLLLTEPSLLLESNNQEMTGRCFQWKSSGFVVKAWAQDLEMSLL